MGNRLFYIGMVLGLSACFLVLFAPCGLIFCGIHYLDKRKDREAEELEAQRQAHIERIIKLGQDRVSASIIVDEMREEHIDPLLPDQPPNTPDMSPLTSPIMRAIYALEEQDDASRDIPNKLYTRGPETPELGTPEADTPEADTAELETPELDSVPLVPSNMARVPTPPVPEPIPQRNQRRPFLGDGSPCLLVLRRSTPPPPPPNNSPMFSPIRSFLAQGRSRERCAEADLEAAQTDLEAAEADFEAAATGLSVPGFPQPRERDDGPPSRQYTDEERDRYLKRAFRMLDARRPGWDADFC